VTVAWAVVLGSDLLCIVVVFAVCTALDGAVKVGAVSSEVVSGEESVAVGSACR